VPPDGNATGITRAALHAQIVDPVVLLARVADLPVADEVIAHVEMMLRAILDAA